MAVAGVAATPLGGFTGPEKPLWGHFPCPLASLHSHRPPRVTWRSFGATAKPLVARGSDTSEMI